MPSNREVGFDPKWNEEQRLEYYRSKAENSRKENRIDMAIQPEPQDNIPDLEPEYNSPVQHPFLAFAEYCKAQGMIVAVSPIGTFELWYPDTLTLTQDFMEEAARCIPDLVSFYPFGLLKEEG
jgi:hypothetical protein